MKWNCLSLAALVAAVVLSGSVVGQKDKDKKPESAVANYAHVVIFQVKKDAPKEAVSAAIADCHEMLAGIPSVRGLKVGRPAEKASPEFAKKNYDFALLVLVDNFDGLKAYLDHPMHLKFVEKHGKHFDLEKLQVFDFQDQKK